MRHPFYLTLLFLTLFSNIALAEKASLQVTCMTSDDVELLMKVWTTGRASITIAQDGNRYDCPLKLEEVEGPPISPMMGDILLVEAIRGACIPLVDEREVMKEAFLHIYDHHTPTPKSRLLVMRKRKPANCSIQALDIEALKTIHELIETR